VYTDLLAFLRCPACRGTLELSSPRHTSDGELIAGMLACGCGRRFPIRGGIADFLGRPRPLNPTQLINELPPAAWAYERLWRPHALTLLSGAPLPYPRELGLVLEWAGPQAGGLVIDVACSNGLYARALADRLAPGGGSVVGVDHAMPMLVEARRRARAAGLRVSYVRAEAQVLPFAAQAASLVTIGGSLNEIGDLQGCLAEVRRTLAGQGRFIAMTLTTHPRPFERIVQTLLGPGGVRFWESGALVEQMAAQQLGVVARQQHGIVLFTLALPL
jgi:SAM-dependent methyltransferase/uncharacterized protein YbaR (Trm112 family)